MDYIFLLVAVLWLVQFVMAWWQLQRFHARIAQLRKEGRTAVGMKGNRFGRIYGVLVANDRGLIERAEVFDGWTVFSRLRPVPGLQGQPITIFDGEQPATEPMRKAHWEALRHAAGFLKPATPRVE